MKRVHVIGGKNHGKTTLITDLICELAARGLRVGTIKHTHHKHELDIPGKDSYRHRESGASVVGILSRSMNALFWPIEPEESLDESRQAARRYEAFSSAFFQCDLVLVEGDTRTTAPKIEVWRATFDSPPLAGTIANVRAIVTSDAIETRVPLLPRDNISGIADFLLTLPLS